MVEAGWVGRIAELGFLSARRRVTLPILIALVLVFGAGDLSADGQESSFRSFVNGVGEMVCALAWPSAEYERVSFGGIREVGGTAEVRFRLFATSAFSGGTLWADVVIEITDGQIADLRWGNYNSFVPPGTTAAALGALLEDLANEWSANSGSSTGSAAQNVVSGSARSNNDNYRQVLDRQLSAERSRVRLNGFRESHQPFYASLRDNLSSAITLRLQQGTTYRIAGYCDQDCSDLDLRLQNSAGETLVSDTAIDDYPKLTFTPRVGGQYTVRVSMITCKVSPCYFVFGTFSK